MKRYLIISLLLIASLWTVTYVVADEGIEFDSKLQEYLQAAYNTTDLSKEFAQSIEVLDVSNLNLTSAKGLEHFTNVKELNVSNNLLTDSTFLKELDKLIVLDLSFNEFEDIELASTHIEELNLEANRISAIDFVQSLEKLNRLNLRANNVVDLEPIEGLTSLTYLNIRGNQVKVLDSLASLEQLSNLNARNNQIRSIEPIIHLPLHNRLYVSGNNLLDLNLFEDRIEEIEEIDFEIGIPQPQFSAESGVYTESFMLEMLTEEGHEIYYTLDGSIPNAQSQKYEGSIEISEEVMQSIPVISNNKTSGQHDGFSFEPEEVKKAITITAVSSRKVGKVRARTFSKPISKTYILDTELFSSQLPVISLTVEPRSLFDDHEGIYVPGVWYEEDSLWSGNYSLQGREYEKEGIMEYFDEHGTVDFYQDIGIRINGRASRMLPQKSLRLYARSEYGQSRFYTNVFESLPYDEFNLLLLRNSGQDYNSTLMRDGLMHELIKDHPVDVQAYKPLIVLINGEYWGIHNLREKFDENYIDIKYNVKEKDLVLMKGFLDDGFVDFDMKAGSANDKKDYHELLDFVRENDLTDDRHVKHVEENVDIDNFFHYVAYQVYFTNTDSFSNNIMLWRKQTDYDPEAPVGHDGRWRWMLFDLDFGMGFRVHENTDYDGDPVDYNMIQHVLKDEERMLLFRKLMENENMQNEFIKVMIRLLNTNFESDHVTMKIDELANTIRPEIAQSIARWENIESPEQWEENLNVLYEFAEKRPQVIKEHVMEEFNLTEEDLKGIEEAIITE